MLWSYLARGSRRTKLLDSACQFEIKTNKFVYVLVYAVRLAVEWWTAICVREFECKYNNNIYVCYSVLWPVLVAVFDLGFALLLQCAQSIWRSFVALFVIWLVNRHLSSSVVIVVRQFAPTYSRTPSRSVLPSWQNLSKMSVTTVFRIVIIKHQI